MEIERYLPEMVRGMVDADRQIRAACPDGLLRAFERLDFRAFDIHGDDRRKKARQDMIDGDALNPGRARGQNSGSETGIGVGEGCDGLMAVDRAGDSRNMTGDLFLMRGQIFRGQFELIGIRLKAHQFLDRTDPTKMLAISPTLTPQ